MTKLSFHYFHLMPWPYLPDDFDDKYDSAWVTLPNSIYDPVKGHALYNRYFDEIERADKLVQLIARQKGLSHPVIDGIVTLVDSRLEANRKKAAASKS